MPYFPDGADTTFIPNKGAFPDKHFRWLDADPRVLGLHLLRFGNRKGFELVAGKSPGDTKELAIKLGLNDSYVDLARNRIQSGDRVLGWIPMEEWEARQRDLLNRQRTDQDKNIDDYKAAIDKIPHHEPVELDVEEFLDRKDHAERDGRPVVSMAGLDGKSKTVGVARPATDYSIDNHPGAPGTKQELNDATSTSSSAANHLAPGYRGIIGTRLDGRETWYSQWASVETSVRNYEDWFYSTGLPVAATKTEGSDIMPYSIIEGNTIRLEFGQKAIGFMVTDIAWEDDLYKSMGSGVRNAPRELADSMAEAVELDAHRLVNAEAFLTSAVPTYLRVLPANLSTESLFNTGHAPVTGGEATSQANRPSTDVDLTVSSARDAITAFRRYTDDRGKRIPGHSRPNRLLIPPELGWKAGEIFQSSNRPDTANRVENVSRGALQIIGGEGGDPYITDTDQWVMLAPEHMLKFVWRSRPTLDAYDDKSKRVSVFVGIERYGYIALGWLGTYGSTGA